MSDKIESLLNKMPLIKDVAEKLYNEWSKKNKRANILILGKTGVGKSTLINAVFRDELASTGVGRPVTQGIEEITKEGMPISILDSKGLELADYEEIKSTIINEIEDRRGEDPDKYVHLAWLCLSDDSKRIEDAEIEIAKSLKKLGVYVIVIITKATRFKDNEFKNEVEKYFKDIADDVCITRGISEDIYGDDDDVIGKRDVKGINELISASYRLIPDSQRQSFANVLSIKNKKSIELKRKESGNIINIARGAAGAAAVTPLPFSDAFMLIPIQVTMIIKISQTYGISVTQDAMLPAITALVGSSATTLVGRTLVSSLLKFVPGVGSVLGGGISAIVASQLTSTMGNLYIDVLHELLDEGKPLEFSAAMSSLKSKLSL